MIYIVLRKQDGRFPLYNNGGTLEFLEANNKPATVSWKDFIYIILQNKYAFSKETVEGIKFVEPLFSSDGDIFVYVELGVYRLYSVLPFFCVSFPFKQSKHSLSKKVKENFIDIKTNLEMLNLWQ